MSFYMSSVARRLIGFATAKNRLWRQANLFARLGLVVAAVCFSEPVRAQDSDNNLKVYAVNVVKTRPLEKQFTGYGIYLGDGKVITAAHVVGHWPALTHPRVLIAGQDLPAKVLKIGSLETTDLALLSIDQARLPASLQLRRNPLCKTFPPVRAKVIVVYPERTIVTRSFLRSSSPLSIASAMPR